MIIVYSKPNCPQCDLAKHLLKINNREFEEVIIDVGQEKDPSRSYITVLELKAKIPNAATAPQITIRGAAIGGAEALKKFLKEDNRPL